MTTKVSLQICHNYKTIYIGLYNDKEMARCAYQTKARELHGAFYRE